MIHCVWTCVQGNANELRKEADTLDLFTKSLISVYRTKFNKTDDEIMSLLESETWILGEQAKDYGLNCIVNDIGSEIRIAAKCDLSKFKNLPKVFNMENEEKKPEQVEETKELEEENKEKVEEALEEVEKTEETEEQKPTYEELEQKIQELEEKIRELEKPEEETQEQPEEETVTVDECQKRVSGMQAKMQLHVNDLMGQLKAKDKELTDANAKVISLTSELESKAKELSEKASALAEKERLFGHKCGSLQAT